MAHMAAMSLHVHRDVLADSKSAPNCSCDFNESQTASQEAQEVMIGDDLSNFFDAFIDQKVCGKRCNSVDVSTDSGSAQLNKSQDHHSN